MENLIILSKKDLEEILKKASMSAEVSEPVRKSMNIDEAVQYLNDSGFKISKSTIYKNTMDGTIPFQRFGKRRLVFKSDDLDQWVNERISGENDDIAVNVAKSAKRKGR